VSRYSGQQPPGARHATQAVKRIAAEDRNAATPTERTAWFRRERTRVQAAVREHLDAQGRES
jgi:hypothetical protein